MKMIDEVSATTFPSFVMTVTVVIIDAALSGRPSLRTKSNPDEALTALEA
jgi:hypothetical protein